MELHIVARSMRIALSERDESILKEKYLCFGTFVSILCSQRKNDTRLDATGTLISIVDKKNTCCTITPRKKDEVEQKCFNKTQIYRVHRGESAFQASEWCIVDEIEYEDLLKEIKEWASETYYDVGCKERITLAIYDVIKNDSSIEIENKTVFKKYFGVSKEEFLANESIDFFDLIARILMYTVGATLNAKVQKKCQSEFYKECEAYMAGIQMTYEKQYVFVNNCLVWTNNERIAS